MNTIFSARRARRELAWVRIAIQLLAILDDHLSWHDSPADEHLHCATREALRSVKRLRHELAIKTLRRSAESWEKQA